MMQSSITSFFSRAPPKAKDNSEDTTTRKHQVTTISTTQIEKRKRDGNSDASDEKSESPKHTSEKKNIKKLKAQKISPSNADVKSDYDGNKPTKRKSEQKNVKKFKAEKVTVSPSSSYVKDDSGDDGNKPTKKKKKRIVLQSDSSDEEPNNGLTKAVINQNLEVLIDETESNKNKVENGADVETKSVVKITKSELLDDGEIKSESSDDKAKKIHPFFNSSKPKTEVKSEDVVYNPTAARYDPVENAVWKFGAKVPYLALAKTLEEIENVSARLKMIEILSNFFRSVIVLSPDDLLPSVYLCLNKLGPAYEGLELGVAETSLMKAVAQSTGRTIAQIKADAQAAGDLGVVAEQSRNNQRIIFKPAPLILRSVFEKLKEIAKMSGHASQTKKVEKIQTMFVACRQSEARFLIRSLAGKLRIGLAEQSVLQALALACTLTPPNQTYPPKILNASKAMSSEGFKNKYDELALILKTTYCECPNYDLIIPVLLKDGIEKLPQHCKLTPGIPLKPMLAHPTKGVQEVLQRFEGLKFTCEWKYDGERAQIHIDDDGQVSIYSRNQENNTTKYPDVIARLGNCITERVKSCVLDCETVAWDVEKKQILPFQILSTRKRKDATEDHIKVQVCVFMFDLLFLNGEPLVKKPFCERRSMLRSHFKEHEGQWCFATSMDTKTMEEVQEFLEESVKGNCEGLMVKTLEEEATYEIAKRSRNWLKLKKDYLEGVGDTLDVVVIGGYLGKGKRTGTYGGFLLACYDQESEEYQSICKIGTGFSDEALQTHTEFLKGHLIPQAKSYYRYDTSHEPDHWFDAVQVWEIKCADLSLSPVHRAALGIIDPEKGISLRFPRFIRVRDDKTVEMATSAQQVADMYSSQDQIKNQQGGKVAEEDFY